MVVQVAEYWLKSLNVWPKEQWPRRPILHSPCAPHRSHCERMFNDYTHAVRSENYEYRWLVKPSLSCTKSRWVLYQSLSVVDHWVTCGRETGIKQILCCNTIGQTKRKRQEERRPTSVAIDTVTWICVYETSIDYPALLYRCQMLSWKQHQKNMTPVTTRQNEQTRHQ